jgi:hypothetical protein
MFSLERSVNDKVAVVSHHWASWMNGTLITLSPDILRVLTLPNSHSQRSLRRIQHMVQVLQHFGIGEGDDFYGYTRFELV